VNKLIKGGKKVKLVGGPGDGMLIIVDGKAQALEYEVKEKKYYYRWDGLSDGVNELYSFVGSPEQNNPTLDMRFNKSNLVLPSQPGKEIIWPI
jgi:hypothetical protein